MSVGSATHMARRWEDVLFKFAIELSAETCISAPHKETAYKFPPKCRSACSSVPRSVFDLLVPSGCASEYNKNRTVMNFELTEEQTIFYESTRKFALNELSEGAVARAYAGNYPWDISRKLAGAGLFGIAVAQEDGVRHALNPPPPEAFHPAGSVIISAGNTLA